jgi:hypothetical protein
MRVQRTRSRSPLTRRTLGDVWGRMRAPIATFQTRAFELGVGEGAIILEAEGFGVGLGVGR